MLRQDGKELPADNLPPALRRADPFRAGTSVHMHSNRRVAPHRWAANNRAVAVIAAFSRQRSVAVRSPSTNYDRRGMHQKMAEP